MENTALNTIEKIKNLEVKPANNKILREAFKIVFPYGTVPKNIDKLKEEIISLIKYKVINQLNKTLNKDNQKYYDKGVETINFIENNLK